jgi:hypothetical protein
MNGDWLRRANEWIDILVLIGAGSAMGFGLCLRRRYAICVILMIGLAFSVGGIAWSYYSNYWFPWLVVTGGQVPFALAYAFGMDHFRSQVSIEKERPGTSKVEGPKTTTKPEPHLPDCPDYELYDPPFGKGAYGKVWLVRNAVSQWQALKVISLANFNHDTDPYEREFNGIRKYKPVSDRHPGLLRVDFISRMKPEGYFYYVMELGDALEPGWEDAPSSYKPRDLVNESARFPGNRIPVEECLRIGLALSEALEFLHQQKLMHRDIKPQNIIFVKNQPKLADIGLISNIRQEDRKATQVGTPGYLPPYPEPAGTPQADIYALGMVLYVISTGKSNRLFPEISTTIVEATGAADFLPLNDIILKACHPDCDRRFASASQLHEALQKVQQQLG